ncbi:uncharacterized protein LOC130719169 [Lotus japonicus]|uniref:uncharacterized protein LOC130719169 n=1 Tax=Lotus japonicus TaxID=34305 RepID=UPI0025851FC0|nr:uncharacterized protein LOC130719169 [Lotus japonicus]
MTEFNRFIDDLEVMDVPLHGRKFTWFGPNGQSMSRLDRFLVSDGWTNHWPHCFQSVLVRDISDHCPLLLRSVVQNWGPKPFRVLNCWFQHPSFKKFVLDSWSSFQVQGRGIFVIKEKLKLLKAELKKWNVEVFGNVLATRRNIVKRLQDLDVVAENVGLSIEETKERQQVQAEFWRIAKLNESLLFQKSRLRWIKEGDMNTKYFHSIVNWKRKTDSIVGLVMDGSWVEDVTRVKERVKEFFEEKFQNQPFTRRPRLDGVLFNQIYDEDNRRLCACITLEEIREAVWDCDGNKSLGPDGYNFKFIKEFWEILKEDLKGAVEDFWTNRSWPRGSNASFIVLIPKVDSTQGLHEFRPILLIGCLFKVVAKILATRLKGVLPKVIDEKQSAFLGGCNMLDG